MKVVTFGEIMLRLAPNGFLRFSQMGEQLQATFGGAEANVAVCLANYGMEASFVSRLPTHAIGQCALNEVRKYGVDTAHIVRGGDRVGIYYLEKGASQRGSTVVYDRANSAICTAKREDFDWKTIFQGANWFHFSGITPALNETVASICLDALKEAKAQNLTVSCDLNYRQKLWETEKAGATMRPLMQYVDVCIANGLDANNVFSIKAENTDMVTGWIPREGYVGIAKELCRQFGFKKVATTFRTALSASENKLAGMFYDDGEITYSKEYHLHLVDRVGGGDSFVAGLIYALQSGFDQQKTVDFAVASSVLKHAIEGDFNRVTKNEVLSLVGGDASGRILR